MQKTKCYKKNDFVVLEITDLTEEGQGVGKCDGLVFFVKGTVMGDVVEAKILKVKKNYAYAKVEKLLEASPYRITPLCPVAGKCGGCQLQHLSYEKELAWKEDRIAQSLIRIAGISEEEVRKRGEGILGGAAARLRSRCAAWAALPTGRVSISRWTMFAQLSVHAETDARHLFVEFKVDV